MAYGDNRRTPKMRRRRAQQKYKARVRAHLERAKAKKSDGAG